MHHINDVRSTAIIIIIIIMPDPYSNLKTVEIFPGWFDRKMPDTVVTVQDFTAVSYDAL